MRRYTLPRLRDFLFAVIFLGGLLSGTRMLNTDSDFGRHLVLGNYILDSHQIPTRDILSETKAGESRPPYEWLAEVLFALAYRLANLDGVVLLSAALIGIAFTLVFADAAHRSGAPVIALVISLWAAEASSLHWVSRPHLFSFLFFAIWLAMLERLRRREGQALWQFPVLMLVWANTHGGFIFGFLAYGAYLAGWVLELWQRHSDWRAGRGLLITGAASLVASIITPGGWGNWIAILNNRSSFILSQTVETMPLNLRLINSWPFLGLLVLAIILMVLSRKQLARAHALLLAGLAVISFVMARNVPFFVIATAPLCTTWLAGWLCRIDLWAKLEHGFSSIDRSLHGFLWSAAAFAAALGLFFFHFHATQTPIFQWSPSRFPVNAAAWLERNPQPGRMFNDFNWGGYLLFRVWPQHKVFIDSQTDFYGEQFVRQYAGLMDAVPGWDALLAQYHVGWLLLSPSSPLAAAASRDPAWRVAYQDTTAVILVRR